MNPHFSEGNRSRLGIYSKEPASMKDRNSLGVYGALHAAWNKRGFLAVAASVLLIAGCGSMSTPVNIGPQGKLYVAVPFTSSGTSAIFRFDNPSMLSGSVMPAAVIAGNHTQLNVVESFMALDKTADRLFMIAKTNEGYAILSFDHMSTRDGNFGPDRVITGQASLVSLLGPLAVDSSRDILYAETAVDATGNFDVLMFKNASTLNGNVTPSAVLQVSASGMAFFDLVVDEANNRLFALTNAQSIGVFDNASNLASGLMVPDRVISGPDTGLGLPFHIALDPAGRLLVASQQQFGAPASIEIFANAGTASGDVSPVATIAGSSTGLNVGGPGAMAVFTGPGASAGGDLYVNIQAGTVLVFKNIATANGNVAPDHSFAVASPDAGSDLGLRVDTSR